MLTDKCLEDFKSWAIEKYGYSDHNHLGFPVVFEFFDQFLEWELPKYPIVIGPMKERILIRKLLSTIQECNKVYNETF